MKKILFLIVTVIALTITPNVYAAQTVDCSNETAEAKVGSSCYKTLKEAIESVTGQNNTVRLLKDVSNYTLTISKDQNIILDLGTHKLTAPTNSWAIYNEGNLNIFNGTIVGSSNSAAIRNNGIKLTVKSVTVESPYIAIINNDVVAENNVEQQNRKPELIIEDCTIKGPFSSCGLQLSGKATVKNTTFNAKKGNTIIKALDGKTDSEIILDNLSTNYRGIISAGKDSTNDEHNIKIEIKNITDTAKEKMFLSSAGDAIVVPDNSYVNVALQYALSGSTIIIPEEFYMDNIKVKDGVNIQLSEESFSNQIIEKNANGTYNIIKKADYSEINKLKNEIDNLNKDDFTKETWEALQKVLSTIDYNKSIKEQDEVNNIAKALEKAINNLVKINKNNIKNPNTSDINLIITISTILISIIGVYFIVKKRFN